MSYTQAQLDAIDAAIATGTLRVRNANGEMVEYRTLDEMMKARAIVASGVAGPARRRARGFYPSYSRFPAIDTTG